MFKALARAIGILFASAAVALPRPAAAQFSGIYGLVVGSSKAQLPGAAVVLDNLDGTRWATTTDSAGVFSFRTLRPGTYRLEASHVGYDPLAETVRVDFDEVAIVELVLTERAEDLGEVTVEDIRQGGAQPDAGRFRITPQQLARASVPGLSPDLMGSLLTTPGTMRLADLGGHLFIRGGTPTQNLVLVDGMTIYRPFHIVGFYSAFPADVIAYTDVYAGGFGARYGGRLSSVIDVSTRSGSKDRAAVDLSLAPFLTSGRIELPIRKNEVSLIVSGRESVIERVAPALVDVDLPYRFGDYFAKFHAFLNPTSSFSATALKTYDRGDFVTADDASRSVSWTNEAVGARYQFLPAEYPLMSEFSVHVSRYRSRFKEEGDSRLSNVREINGDIDFTYLLGDQELNFGIFGRSNFFEFDLGAQGNENRETISEGGAFVDFRWSVTRQFRLEPGFRLQGYSGGIGTSVEPRVRARYTPAFFRRRHTLGLATGVYRQQILGIASIDDLTDAFVAWAPAGSGSKVPSAIHGIASWAFEPGPSTRVRVEGYLKRMLHLSNPRYDRAARRIIPADNMTGIARGVDFQVERLSRRIYLNVSYSLASITYRGRVPVSFEAVSDPLEITFHPSHDRRHHINVAARYDPGPFSVSLLWQYGSGQPFSEILGFYNEIGPPVAGRPYVNEPGKARVAHAPPYAGRLPSYSRLDVSVERRILLSRISVSVEAGVVNVYDRKNIFDYSVFTGRRINQLPLIPYAGIKTSF